MKSVTDYFRWDENCVYATLLHTLLYHSAVGQKILELLYTSPFQPGAMLPKWICCELMFPAFCCEAWINIKQWQKVCLFGLRESILGLVLYHRWYCSADTVAWKANSWQRHPWHAETWGEPLLYCVWQMDNSIGPVHSGLLSLTVVGGLVCFIKVPSASLHEGYSQPSVCWHHTEFCPLRWLVPEPGRQGQTSRCYYGELGFLRGKLSFLLIQMFGFFNSITRMIT